VDLLNKVAAVIPSKWRYVGLQLGLPPGELGAISHTYDSDLTYCFVEVFVKWRNNMTKSYAWSELLKALRSPIVAEARLAQSLERWLISVL